MSTSSSQSTSASSQRGKRVDAKHGDSMDIESADHERFRELADRWQEETFFLSRSDLKNAHPALQEIISIGPPIVPLILERMCSQGGHWFEALQQLTGARPVPPESRGRIKEMTRAWLEWGERNDYVQMARAAGR